MTINKKRQRRALINKSNFKNNCVCCGYKTATTQRQLKLHFNPQQQIAFVFLINIYRQPEYHHWLGPEATVCTFRGKNEGWEFHLLTSFLLQCCMILDWEEARIPRENPGRHGENMPTLHGESKKGTFLLRGGTQQKATTAPNNGDGRMCHQDLVYLWPDESSQVILQSAWKSMTS